MMNYAPYMNQFQMKPNNGIIWVQGIEGAKAYQLVPNSNAVLLDSENEGIFYIKISDAVGMCTLRTFKYTEIQELQKPKDVDMSEYVTKAELTSALQELRKEKSNGKHTVQSDNGKQSK